jgi:hypothetical protein
MSPTPKKSAPKKSAPKKGAPKKGAPTRTAADPAQTKVSAPEEAAPKEAAAAQQKKPAYVTSEERWRMVAEAAYHKAEKRGFATGHETEDWLEAEQEVDALLGGKKQRD